MKRVIRGFGYLIIAVMLSACQIPTPTPNPNLINNIELMLDTDTLTVSSSDDRLMIETKDLGDHLEITITIDDPLSFGVDLTVLVDEVSIASDHYDIETHKVILSIPHPNPVDPNSYVDVVVTLDPNGGYWSKEMIDAMIPNVTLTISTFDDFSGLTFTLFDQSRTTLRWYYKLFIAYEEALDAYRVVYADPSTASIEDLVLPDYDYVIGVHLHTTDIVARDTVIDLTTSFEEPMMIRFDQPLESYVSGDLEVSIYDRNQLTSPVDETYNEITMLPLPIKETYTFVGWSDGNEIYQTFPRYQVKEGIKAVTYVAVWEGASMSELQDFLDDRIPLHASDHIVLPLTYGGFDIVWESSHPDVIDESGHYKKPYQDTTVTLSAIVTSDSVSDVLTFEVETSGYKPLTGPIASSYIYRGYASVSDSFFEILDVINTAFITAQPDGSLTGNVYLDNVSTYILPKARIHGNWVIMSIAPDSAWSTIAASSTLINTFADHIVDTINQYGFDGVDIDWETPTPSETTRYTQLIRTVYEKVKANNPNHLVTTAITGGMWQPPRYDLINSAQYVDYINMMTYGMVTSGAQYHNALYPSSTYHNPTFRAGKTLLSCSVEESVTIFHDQYSVPLNKIVVGVAFYGVRQSRTYDTVSQTWSSWTFASSVFYTDIAAHYLNNSAYTKAYDNTAGVPYLIKTDGTEFISYDNFKSIRDKGTYIIDESLGGMMYWENGTDSTGTLLEAIREGLNK